MTPVIRQTQSDHTSWQALRWYGAYRLILAVALSILVITHSLPAQFGQIMPDLFKLVCFAYAGFAVIVSLLIEYHVGSVRRQAILQVMVDLLVLGVFLFTSGGVVSGLGLLLVISVAAGSLLVLGRIAYFFAAFASLVVLVNEALLNTYLFSGGNYTQAGLLGAVFFMTAFLSHTLARRLRETEALAAKRGADLASLARMNARIVQRMRSGVMVVNHTGEIVLANASAERLLARQETLQGRKLFVVSSALNDHLQQWRRGEAATRLLRVEAMEVQVSMTSLGRALGEEESEILIFLEDAAAIRQRAQQLKLVSLGQLTASIAHEVRNPLGAISHAGQLLAESEALTPPDQRLLQIIRDHSSRVNRIIENVLNLGRRDNSSPEILNMNQWLPRFCDELRQIHSLPEELIVVQLPDDEQRVMIDPSQLEQVLSNLCENALRYSQHEPKVRLRMGLLDDSQRPYLDVRDTGPGIAPELVDNIFEPFFTDRSGGTGLGLYIASELCEANQAILALVENTNAGCCFRITFPHPDKQIQIE